MALKKEEEEKGDTVAERFQVLPDKETSSSESSSESTSSSSESESSNSSTSSSSSTDDEDEQRNSDKQKTHAKKPPARPILSGKSSPTKTKIKKRKRKPRPLTICLSNCRYEVVRQVAKKYALREVNEDEAWNIYWTDFSVSLERAMDMRRYQIVNHFPGMNEICRKDLLARNLNRMRRLFPQEYGSIYPKTWSLPADLGELQTYAHSRKNKTYICKPEMGCQGRGIFLVRSIKDLNPFGRIICQLYVAKPFLIDSFKFDLRIYVLITSCDPLRVYVYKEGLARFATAKYKPPTNSNTENSYMHLTNYAVNKYSRDYVIDDEGGSKRRLTSVYKWLEERNYDVKELIENIDEVIMKTIISAHPVLKHNYRTCFPNHDICSACFEILGFDILIDYKLKPCVLEVNHSPSFHTDSKLDLEIKEGLLDDTLAMLNMKSLDRHKVENADRKRIQERLLSKTNPGKKEDENPPETLSPVDKQFAHEVENAGGYRLIYPTQVSDKYDRYFEQNMSSLYQETAASQARANCTRTQIEEYNQKKLEEEKKRAAVSQKENLAANKDKVRPESPLDNEKRKNQRKNRKPEPVSSFVPSSIMADEELDRMKGLMQRGMLIRSLGIELQAFKLLCQIGNLKPEEEQVFRRMHGFTNPFSNSKGPGKPYNRDIHSAGGDLYQDQLKYFHTKTSQAVPHTNSVEAKHSQSKSELESGNDSFARKKTVTIEVFKTKETSADTNSNASQDSPRQKCDAPVNSPMRTRPQYARNLTSATPTNAPPILESQANSPKLRYLEEQLNSMAAFLGESGSSNKSKKRQERGLVSERLATKTKPNAYSNNSSNAATVLPPLSPPSYQVDLLSGIKEYTRNTSRASAQMTKTPFTSETETKAKPRRRPPTPRQPDRRDLPMETLPLGTQIQRSVWASAFALPSVVEPPKVVGFPNPLLQTGNARGNLGFTGFIGKPQQAKQSTIPITQMFDTKKPEPKLPGLYQLRGNGTETYNRPPHFIQMGTFVNGRDPTGNSMMLTGIRLGPGLPHK